MQMLGTGDSFWLEGEDDGEKDGERDREMWERDKEKEDVSLLGLWTHYFRG